MESIADEKQILLPRGGKGGANGGSSFYRWDNVKSGPFFGIKELLENLLTLRLIGCSYCNAWLSFLTINKGKVIRLWQRLL